MSKTAERRSRLRLALIDAAERAIAEKGLAGLKTRDLAREIGVANGAVYNLVADVDELILHVSSRTLARLDAAVTAAEGDEAVPARDRLERIALAYCDFAAANLELWRALFEHRMAPGKTVPEWAVTAQMSVFRHVVAPLNEVFPAASDGELGLTARSLFSAVHGIVALGLEQKLVAVPQPVLKHQVATMVDAMITGLGAITSERQA